VAGAQGLGGQAAARHPPHPRRRGQRAPVGEAGTIYFESASRRQFEYHNDPEKTASSRDPKGRGWSTLGDIGRVDEDGYLYLTDRKAYMIISGGVNIYPQEAENVLTMHPKVLDVAVFGVPNEDFGEEVKAVVQPMDMADAGPELERELIAFCKEHLADVKCPRSVDFEAELPRHPTGKLYKRLLSTMPAPARASMLSRWTLPAMSSKRWGPAGSGWVATPMARASSEAAWAR
jgi:acyl-CoA synthetase (AMP-forming)/AMP-acid ligase II